MEESNGIWTLSDKVFVQTGVVDRIGTGYKHYPEAFFKGCQDNAEACLHSLGFW